MIITKTFDSNNSTYSKEPEYNTHYLRAQQNYFNDCLQMRGHVFLNEVYDSLGMPRTRIGATHGWAVKGTKRLIDIKVSVDARKYEGLDLRFDVEEILDFLEDEKDV